MIKYTKEKFNEQDFNARKEKVISMIKDKKFIAGTKTKYQYQFTEQELRDDFIWEDGDEINSKYVNMFFDGNYILFPLEKMIII